MRKICTLQQRYNVLQHTKRYKSVTNPKNGHRFQFFSLFSLPNKARSSKGAELLLSSSPKKAGGRLFEVRNLRFSRQILWILANLRAKIAALRRKAKTTGGVPNASLHLTPPFPSLPKQTKNVFFVRLQKIFLKTLAFQKRIWYTIPVAAQQYTHHQPSWIEHKPPTLGVDGSNPPWCAKKQENALVSFSCFL